MELKGSVGTKAEMNPVGRGSSVVLEKEGWISRVSQAGLHRCSAPGRGPGLQEKLDKTNHEDPWGAASRKRPIPTCEEGC